VKIHRIKRSSKQVIGGVKVRTFPMTHAYPDNFGVAIMSDQGAIVYTGEFIVDYDMLSDQYSCDLNELSDIGKRGVLCLLSESQGVERNGHTAPNHRVTNLIEPIFEKNNGRILISVYRQSLYRVIEIIEICKRMNRKIYFHDKELRHLLKHLEDMKYYHVPREMEATDMENEIYKEGGHIFSLNSKTVFSMHPSSEDLKMMLYLFKPKYYIPVKGEYRHLVMNANLGVSMGYSPDRILILDNGQIAVFENTVLKSVSDHLTLEDTLIDGKENWDVTGVVLKDREVLSTDGVMIIGVGVHMKTKEVINGPDVQTRGLIYLKDADYIIKEVGEMMEECIATAVKEKRYDNLTVRGEAREKITKYLVKQTGKRPMVLPVIMEINV